MKGESQLIKLQRQELKSMVADYKRLKGEWRKAKFHPSIADRRSNAMTLAVGLREVFTTSLRYARCRHFPLQPPNSSLQRGPRQ